MSTPVLDHGYVGLVETWGSDESIVEAARMSTGKGFQGWEKDEKFLKFLYDNKHSTPFEMAGAIFEIKAPIFIFREWHRHRTQSYNEMSARYVPLPDENYVPSVERILDGCNTVTSNKQAQSMPVLDPFTVTAGKALSIREQMRQAYLNDQITYDLLLLRGLPKELARLVLPVGRYSKMRAGANLRNWLAFLTLRQAPNAQWEIRQYADVVAALLTEKFPKTMELFNNEKD
jgi:thymidylate synthase (FAD)